MHVGCKIMRIATIWYCSWSFNVIVLKFKLKLVKSLSCIIKLFTFIELKSFLFSLIMGMMIIDVQILILASAQIVCNIVYVQVQGRIHRELRCKN
jgi:hypothetical protein